MYDSAEGVMQVDGSNVKESFRDATDTTLSQADVPADAKAVGDRFAKVEKKNTEQDAALKTKAGGTGIEQNNISCRMGRCGKIKGCIKNSRN